MRALITENSRLYRQLLDNLLGQQGFETDICRNLDTAKTFLDTETYDIIFVNRHLEDGTGLELVEYCNQQEANSQAKILYLTSDSSDADIPESFGIDEVIIKQNLQQIADQITHFIEIHLDPVFSEGRILFVEDSKAISAMIMSQLTQVEYEVSHFDNAEEAWDVFINEVSYGSDLLAFDLIITDNNLEGEMTGQDLIAKVRSIDDARGLVPIIAITGENSDELRLSLYQSGVNDFLQKPVMGEELLVRVGNLITNKRLLDKVHDQRRELFAMATTDKLTGCHNRHSLMEFSHKFIAQAQRHQYPVSLMVIDLDHFKSINDTHGHAVGDIVLEAIGKLLNSDFREGDLVARFGGEEFVILLNHCASDDAKIIAEKTREKMEALKPHDLVVTPSIGLTSLDIGEKGSFETMFSIADEGVYAAKENGRNQVVFKKPQA
jgi:two-component system cell cycle response regulator